MAIQKKKTAESKTAASEKDTKKVKKTAKTPKVASGTTTSPVRKRPPKPDDQRVEILDTSDQVIPVRILTPEQLAHFRMLLLQRRARILGDVDVMQGTNGSVNRQDSTGDLSSMPIHMADIGTDNYEQEFTLGLIEGDRKTLIEIDIALQKIENGTYGTCEGTGRPIGLERLEAKPEARYCIEYARLVEKGLVKISSDDDEHDRHRDRDEEDEE